MSDTYAKRTVMPVTAERLYAWHERPGAFERLNPPFDPVEVLERSGGLEQGARTVLRMKIGPVWQKWVAVHTACEPGRLFRDEQESGPFASWAHTHRFEVDTEPASSVMHDEVTYALPMGALGNKLGLAYTRSALERTFRYRHALLRADLARHAQFGDRPRLTIAITGASGLIGSTLSAFLSTGGHRVRSVPRRGNVPDISALEGADVVVNLAGAGIADERWSDSRKVLLADSRVQFTRKLVTAMKGMRAPPKLLIQGSAIGVYGERGDDVLTERSAPGKRGAKAASFLAGLCADWEAEAARAELVGLRVVMLRTGLVQSARGGALAKLLTPFKAGAGGAVGSGRQWQSWISLEDVIGIINHVLFDEQVRGPVNAVAPNPVTNTDYGKTLGAVLMRPAVMPLPVFALRAAFGELADGALLASQRVLPEVMLRLGFSFLHPTLDEALRFTLGKID